MVGLQTERQTWLLQVILLSPVLMSASGWQQQWIWCCKGHNGLAAIGREKESWKTKVSHQVVSKGPIVLFTRALLPGGEAKKKKKYQDKHFLPVMIRSCCLQRSDYTVSQMFKKKKKPTASLYLNYSSSRIVCQSLYKAEWKYCPPVSLSSRDLVKLTLNVLKETLSKITDDFKLLLSMGV